MKKDTGKAEASVPIKIRKKANRAWVKIAFGDNMKNETFSERLPFEVSILEVKFFMNGDVEESKTAGNL